MPAVGYNEPVAHTAKDSRSHLLSDHLEKTSQLASEFADGFGSHDWARLAGLWHDLGKYSWDFQRYIHSSGPDTDAKPRTDRVDHSTYGAQHACEKLNIAGRLIAYIIAGHHAGLPDWQTESSGMSGLAQRLDKKSIPECWPPMDLLNQQMPSEKPKPGTDPSMWIRMLFSCVVDADFLDTESFFDPGKSEMRGDYPHLAELLPLFNAFIENKVAEAAKTPVNRIRAEVLEQCITKATRKPAIFSLTVPTGGGKTLSSMAFALNHAVRHGQRRIIYVIPYTSIIEQTADQFRQIFGEAVLEHHSNIDMPKDQEFSRSRLASENWDAPIVVTTSVQFFESLYSARSSRCRKLHNIVNSVVILDETQLLPPDLLSPILKALAELHKNYGITLLLSTATQPALGPRESDFEFEGLAGLEEIIEDPEALSSKLKRVRVSVPQDLSTAITWEDLASDLSVHPTVLCIVNKRDDCRMLHAMLPKGAIHLSALMCGAHRSEVIAGVKRRLSEGVPTRVISTQLVEAGVDLDFPIVFRALSGLDSIAQAAGRCNREGLLPEGLVKVFVPDGKPPSGYLRQAAEIGRRLLASGVNDPLAPELFTEYFKELYWIHGDRLDKHRILADLKPDLELRFSFRTAAAKFHIIDESQYAPVLVRYGEGTTMLDLLTRTRPERWLLRKLQRYVVNVPRYRISRLIEAGEIEEPHPGIYIQSILGHYDEDVGLVLGQRLDPDDLVI